MPTTTTTTTITDAADRRTGAELAEAEAPGDEALVDDEVLIEEVSIDGMCGVY